MRSTFKEVSTYDIKNTMVNEIYEKMEQKLYAECARMGEKIPYWTVGGVYEEDYAKKDIYWWTNGFWSGILWQLYHATKNELYLETARKNEDLLDQAFTLHRPSPRYRFHVAPQRCR